MCGNDHKSENVLATVEFTKQYRIAAARAMHHSSYLYPYHENNTSPVTKPYT
jgi:hypothetical protein